MSDTLVQEPAVAEPARAEPTPATPARIFGKGAAIGIIVGAIIVIAAAFGGGFLVGSGANAGALGPTGSTQQGPGGAGAPGGAQNAQGPLNGQQGGTPNNQNG